MEPITTVLAWKWLAAHGIIAHAVTAKGTVAAARPVAAGHTGLTATVLGTPIAASTIGGMSRQPQSDRLDDRRGGAPRPRRRSGRARSLVS